MSVAKYVAYGGARGGGKSWALRRKLTLMALRWPGIKLLLLRRSYPELYVNHITPLRAELKGCAEWQESHKQFVFRNGSLLRLGYLADDGDLLRYQGAEYDVIAVDEATQITERQFDCLRACVRGVSDAPKRMYLTCNPGGVGHAWVKRLFIDRRVPDGEDPRDYDFIPAKASDNTALMKACPDYLTRLAAIRDPKIRSAWLDGDWNIFEGQFFTDLCEEHMSDMTIPDAVGNVSADGGADANSAYAYSGARLFAGMDYGFDMLSCVICAAYPDGSVAALYEVRKSGLTLSAAAGVIEAAVRRVEGGTGLKTEYIAMPPDMWNRRQDSGRGGVEIMITSACLPPVRRADARRAAGWQNMREYISGRRMDGRPKLVFLEGCRALYDDLRALTHDPRSPDDASTEPHDITHAPDALRYALMSRPSGGETERDMTAGAGTMW